MMASEIPAAIGPYSIAVAPDSSDKKLNKMRFNTASCLDFALGQSPSRNRRNTLEGIESSLIPRAKFQIVGLYAFSVPTRQHTAAVAITPLRRKSIDQR